MDSLQTIKPCGRSCHNENCTGCEHKTTPSVFDYKYDAPRSYDNFRFCRFRGRPHENKQRVPMVCVDMLAYYKARYPGKTIVLPGRYWWICPVCCYKMWIDTFPATYDHYTDTMLSIAEWINPEVLANIARLITSKEPEQVGDCFEFSAIVKGDLVVVKPKPLFASSPFKEV